MRALPFFLITTLLACSDKSTPLGDGGTFQIPDSGYIYDSGPPFVPDAEAPDSGPFVCNPACNSPEVCFCADTRPPSCGCHPQASYAQACDPQVTESCRTPYTCTIARKLSGPTYLCTDGREGSHCSHVDDRCTTALGCVCQTDFLGTQCLCRGEPGPNPTTCDPMVPASCPDGSCVRVEVQGRPYFVCSDGMRYQPCELGDGTCRTSLGCTCTLAGANEICTCSEPGTAVGEPCDPRVEGSCAAPLVCQVRYSQETGGYVSECAASGPTNPDGGTDPYACDPNAPSCPPGYSCEETFPGRFRCIPDR